MTANEQQRKKSAESEFDRFVRVIRMLRDPVAGCPWDLKQDHSSLRPYLIEEAYEVIEAIEAADDRQLADELGLEHSGWATIVSARGVVEARVLVTDRMTPIRVHDRSLHQIGLPYHWGGMGLVRGDAANELISFVADPNVEIQESKALTGAIRPGRRSRRIRGPIFGGVAALEAQPRLDRDLPGVGQQEPQPTQEG